MNLLPRSLRFALARMLVKASGFSVVSPWISQSILAPSFRSLTRDAYQKNAAFFACLSALAFGFPEPPLLVWEDESDQGRPLPKHPARKLLRKPNPLMSERAFSVRVMSYLGIGGNAYIHKVRAQAGNVVELWPYHDGQIRPVPGGPTWVRGYEFIGDGSAEPTPIKPQDVIHLQWPDVDPNQPWMAQPPLLAAAAEVDADNEASRYLRALLQNDAIPRTVITLPPDRIMDKTEKNRFRAQWQEQYGGNNRAGVAVLDDGATIERLALNMEELAFEAMHAIPETRIAAVMRVPPIIAGLSVGLARSTFANYAEARKAFTEQTLVPLWSIVGDAMQEGLAEDFGDDLILGYDLAQVAALQEDATARWNRVIAAFNAGIIVDENEARGLINLPELTPQQRQQLITVATPVAPMLPAGEPQEPPAQLVDQQVEPAKAKSRKASPQRVAEQLRRQRLRVARALESAVDGFFNDLVARVIGRAASGVATTLPGLDQLLLADDWIDLETPVKQYLVELLAASWPLWDEALGLEVTFALSDPAVVAALSESATRVTGIAETTRTAVRELLVYGAEQGWTIDQLVRGDDDRRGLRDTIQETYKGRARAIARTELAYAQNSASVRRFQEAGIMRVQILDGGSEDSDDICNQLNGSVQTLAWFKSNPLQHPNCVRVAAPIVDD
jgi:HK97 family phage portal protein